MGKKISKEELSNEQIEQLIEEFANLTEEERQKRLLGKGAYKSAYEIPGKDFVIKKPHYTSEAINDMAREYGVNKRLLDEVDLEPPILVTRKDELGRRDPYHIQRRVDPLEKSNKAEFEKLKEALNSKQKTLESRRLELEKLLDDPIAYDEYIKLVPQQQEFNKKYFEDLDSARKNKYQDASKVISEVEDKLRAKDIIGADIHDENITKEGSIFDLGSWVNYKDNPTKSDGLDKMRASIVKKTISEAKSPSKFGIYRSLLPVVAKGGAAVAGGLASLAAEASDATEEGSSIEEAAMEREKQDRKFRNTVGQDTYNASQKLLRSIGPKDLIDPDAQKSQFRTLRNKLK